MRTSCQIYLGRLLLLSAICLFSGQDGKAIERTALSLASFGTAGGKDDTALIQKALDACSAQGKALHIPAMKKPYRVGPLRIPSGSHVTFESGVVLQSFTGFQQLQKLINIVDVRNVELSGYGAVLRMNKTEYKTGEYRHCVFIAGSTNVQIEGLTCADAGGDGFYISGSEKKPFSENVMIAGVKADGSKRQGLTVISAR